MRAQDPSSVGTTLLDLNGIRGVPPNFSTQSIETLPSGRNYSSIVQVTPGVASDANPENTGQSTITVYGSGSP